MPMSKAVKRRRRAKPKNEPVRGFGSEESRAAEFMTVGWLLTTFTALICELGGVVATWYANHHPQALGIAALGGILMFAAVLTGLFSLGLLTAAWKLRIVKPPQGIVVFSIVVALAPLAVLLLKRLLA
jgi:hypothetical protein